VGCGVDLDALALGAGVFDVERMEVVLLCEFVELWIVGVVELIPGHSGSLVFHFFFSASRKAFLFFEES
jgi:hypothetical protein